MFLDVTSPEDVISRDVTLPNDVILPEDVIPLDHPAPEKTFKVSTVTIFGSDTRSDIGYVH